MKKRDDKSLIPFFILGEIIILYVAFIFCGVYKKGMDVITLLNKFDVSLFKPRIEFFNQNTIKGLIVATMVYVLLIVMYLTSRRNLMHGSEYGTATFADINQVNKCISDKNQNMNRILSNNVRMSINTKVTGINNNILVIGGSGAGKTFYMVKPNIMQMIPKGSFIATDPKGELLRATGGMLKKNGYNVKVINLIDMSKSDCYNPFSYLRTENDVIKLVTNIINNTTPKESAATDPFWEKSEGMLLQALFYYVWKEMPPNRRNFQSVLQLLSEAEVNEKNQDSELTKRMKKLLVNSPSGDMHPAYRQYMKVIKGAGDTVRSIIISANSRLALLENPYILRILSRDSLNIKEIGLGVNGDKTTRTALFCVIPDSDKSYNFVIGMLYTQLFQELYYQADFNCNGKLPLTVSLMLDEFANVALPDDFTSLLSTMRSRNINAVIIIQNLAQLKALFKDTWETITGNCDTLIYLGGNEKSTHQYISEYLGKGTIDKRTNGETRGMHGSASRNYDVLGRELLTPDEVRNMDNKKCLVFIKGFNPIMDDKYIPFRHINFSQTCDGGEIPYEHKPSENILVLYALKLLSGEALEKFEESAKGNEKVVITDVSLEELLSMKESEFQSSDESDEEEKLIKKRTTSILSNQDLMDELTKRMCTLEFSKEQQEEIKKSLNVNVKLSNILEYMYPETSVKEMQEKREEYLKQTK